VSATDDVLLDFLRAACVPRDSGHTTGTLQRAEAILAAHPGLATSSIHAAAALGDDATVRRFVERDPGNATAKGGPHDWDPLTHLCFSRYLRLDRSRSDSFVRAATVLLDAGASANTGWLEKDHEPRPVWESAIYGAAGVARHAELTRLLLERGADPNGEETPYHASEGYDNEALQVLVRSGKLTADSLTTMLLRKTDWHDYDGIKWLLGHGADPNRTSHWGKTALHNAVLSDNALEIIEVLLDQGADPTIVAARPERGAASSSPGRSAVAIAARRGRGDVLAAFERRGVPTELRGVDRLVAACARNDAATIRALAAAEPALVRALAADGGELLAAFAGVGNTDGVRHLLDLGVAVDAPHGRGDPYWDITPESTALHVAAWRARHGTVELLVARGANVHARDGKGRTPLMLAVRACVDSYWTDRRSPDSVAVLLRAGASPRDVQLPSGYAEADALLASAGP
jgi:ankyrin repeat protein